jgi:hypothetical protein
MKEIVLMNGREVSKNKNGTGNTYSSISILEDELLSNEKMEKA